MALGGGRLRPLAYLYRIKPGQAGDVAVQVGDIPHKSI